jgi:ornithine carbamoyltransferase
LKIESAIREPHALLEYITLFVTFNATYMHGLPADRNVEVTSTLMDGPQSAVLDQLENRPHAQRAIIALTIRLGANTIFKQKED